MNLKILSQNVEVTEDSHISPDDNAFGLYIPRTNEIKFIPDQSKQQYEDTIIHEMLHCANSQLDIWEEDKTTNEGHVYIVPLTTIILQFIRDNKQFIKGVLNDM